MYSKPNLNAHCTFAFFVRILLASLLWRKMFTAKFKISQRGIFNCSTKQKSRPKIIFAVRFQSRCKIHLKWMFFLKHSVHASTWVFWKRQVTFFKILLQLSTIYRHFFDRSTTFNGFFCNLEGWVYSKVGRASWYGFWSIVAFWLVHSAIRKV